MNPTVFQQLYGWNSINTNVWLPSLSELVGIRGGQNSEHGCYLSAMQGLNLSNWFDTDSKGGAQWNYFIQYNASGGAEQLWACGAGEEYWLRSPVYAYDSRVHILNLAGSQHKDVTSTRAVHPAVRDDRCLRKQKERAMMKKTRKRGICIWNGHN